MCSFFSARSAETSLSFAQSQEHADSDCHSVRAAESPLYCPVLLKWNSVLPKCRKTIRERTILLQRRVYFFYLHLLQSHRRVLCSTDTPVYSLVEEMLAGSSSQRSLCCVCVAHPHKGKLWCSQCGPSAVPHPPLSSALYYDCVHWYLCTLE